MRYLSIFLFFTLSITGYSQDRYPYIQSPTETSVIIAWRTQNSGVGTINYGSSASNLNMSIQDPASTKKHALTITGLVPNTEYYYQVTTNGSSSNVEHFSTAKPPSEDHFKFLLYADCGFNSSQQKDIKDLMEQESNVDFALVAGDVDQIIGNNYQDNFFAVYKNMLARECSFTALGNHDVIADNGNTYLDEFYLPTNNSENTERYYSFTWGNAKFIALDSNSPYTFNTPQYNWLYDQLQCADEHWIFVFFHHPPWTNAWDISYFLPGPFWQYQGNTDMRTSLVPLFQQFGVDYVLNGHAHCYQRGSLNGVRYLISGGGGASTLDAHRNSNSPNISVEKYVNQYMRFMINGDTVTFQSVDINGNIIDSDTNIKPQIPYQASVSTTDVTCGNVNSGEASVNVTGPHAPYSFQWNSGQTTSAITGLTAGTYTVTITDARGCEKIETAEVQDLPEFQVTGIKRDVTCAGMHNGSVDLTVTGGATPYNFSWTNGSTTEDISDLGVGTYSVIVSDASGCTATTSYNIVALSDIHVNAAVTDVSCNGETNGAIDVTLSGGIQPYAFSWSNGATTEDLTGISAGTKSLVVTDSLSCRDSVGFAIAEPPALSLVLENITDVSCNGNNNGEINITSSGGTAPFTFFWSNGATTEDLAAVPAGNYDISVTDDNGCTKTSSFTINEPTALTLAGSITDAGCSGADEGAVDLTVSGGVAPYSYNWSNGALVNHIDQLASGNYIITVTDDNGCTQTASYNVEEFSQPAPSITSTGNLVICAGDSLMLSVDDVYETYQWSTGASGHFIYASTAGIYNVTVTDANGCLGSASAITIEEDNVPDAAFSASVNNMTIDFSSTTNANDYNWDFGDGNTFSDISGIAKHTYTDDGVYEVALVTTNDCGSDTVRQFLVVGDTSSTVGISDLEGKLNVTAYPNPFNDYTIIKFDNPGKANFSFKLYDVTGKLVKEISNITSDQLIVRKENLPANFYFFHLEGNVVATGKLIVF